MNEESQFDLDKKFTVVFLMYEEFLLEIKFVFNVLRGV